MFEEMIKDLEESINGCLARGIDREEIYQMLVSMRDNVRDYFHNKTDSLEWCFGNTIAKHFLEIKQREIAGKITQEEIKRANNPATLNRIFDDLCKYIQAC